MEDKQIQALKAKMTDYARYAYILLIFGSFFFMGAILLADEKTSTQLMVMFSSTLAFLFGSVFFYYNSLKIKRRITEEDQSSM
ncbi:YrhC family protein [Bacillus tianshenii]|nr:YrhC family protein [Bacillus tianshenii]